MSRFITQGRNSWAVTNTHRVHSVRIPGSIEPMDYPKVRSTAWNIFSLAVWAVAIAYAASLWIVG